MKPRFKPITQEAFDWAHQQLYVQKHQVVDLLQRDSILYTFLDTLANTPLRSGLPFIAGYVTYNILDRIYSPLKITTRETIQQFFARHQDITQPKPLLAYVEQAIQGLSAASSDPTASHPSLAIPSIGIHVSEFLTSILSLEGIDRPKQQVSLEHLCVMGAALATHDILFDQ